MTVLCGPTGSQPLPGILGLVTVDAVSVESFLILAGAPELAAVLAPILAGVPFVVSGFCAGDPPADPGLTCIDVQNALQFTNPSVSLPAIAKVIQWWEHIYWYRICG